MFIQLLRNVNLGIPIILVTVFFNSISITSAQKKLSKKGGFLFPINPGKPGSLTGNMGEIRSNHFHGGLDIRTGWASGLPVYASKDGFISRVVMAGEGYGNTVFITHSDGFVTVYAHLEKLSQPLHDYVKRQQYDLESFAVDLIFKKDVFKVKQGDTIAISGNTGSSRGPHLHYEIRDTSGIVHNPLSFGFEEIKDNLSPVIDRLAIYPLDIDARINGKFDRKEILVREAGKDFLASEIPIISGTIGLEIKARDRINNGTSNGGIFCIEMYLDGKLVFFHNLNQFPMAKTNHVNQLINYRNFRLTGEKFQKLYSPDGYFQSKNMPENKKGRIHISPGAIGNIEIFLWDVHGNRRIAKLKLRGDSTKNKQALGIAGKANKIRYDVLDNTLIIKSNGNSDFGQTIQIFSGQKNFQLEPDYKEGSELVYLFDLKRMLPDSVVATEKGKLIFNFKAIVSPEKGINASFSEAGITIPGESLFDTLYLELEQDGKSAVRINSSLIPMAGVFTFSTECNSCSGADSMKYRGYAESVNGIFNKSLFSDCNGGNLFSKTKYLGKFKPQKDSTAPVIRTGICNSQQARFNIYDNLSGIDKIEATINGEWILMVWDKKQHLIYADPWPWQKPMKGEFQLLVTDKSGNQNVFKKNL